MLSGRTASGQRRRLTSFLYSTKTMTRLRRLLWYFRRSCSSRWSLSRGLITSTVCTLAKGSDSTGKAGCLCLRPREVLFDALLS